MPLKNLLTIGSIAILLTGCAMSTVYVTPENATPVPPVNFSQKESPDMTEVTVVRDAGLYGTALRIHCIVNSVPCVTLQKEEKSTFYLKPGQYTMTCQAYGGGGRNQPSMYNTFTAEPNSKLVFRTGISGGATVLLMQSKDGVDFEGVH